MIRFLFPFLFLLFVTGGTALAQEGLPSDDVLKQQLIDSSIQTYPGRCPCPYHTDRAGRRCGKRSAYSRAGGYAPLCYPSDITPQMLAQAKQKASAHLAPKSAEGDKTPMARPEEPSNNNNSFTAVTLLKVIDGDTLKVSLPCENTVLCQNMSVRVRGVDTPELHSKNPQERQKAQAAKTFTVQFTQGKTLNLMGCGRDKYFRLLCDVKANGQDLASALLTAGHAAPYDGGTKPQVH